MAVIDQINPFTPPAPIRKREERKDRKPPKRNSDRDEHAKTQRPGKEHILDEFA